MGHRQYRVVVKALAATALLLLGAVSAYGQSAQTAVETNWFTYLPEIFGQIWSDVQDTYVFDTLINSMILGALVVLALHFGIGRFMRKARADLWINYLLIGGGLTLSVLTIKILVTLFSSDPASWAPETVADWFKLCFTLLVLIVIFTPVTLLATWSNLLHFKRIAAYYILLSTAILGFVVVQPFRDPTPKQISEFYWLREQLKFSNMTEFIDGVHEFQSELVATGHSIVDDAVSPTTEPDS